MKTATVENGELFTLLRRVKPFTSKDVGPIVNVHLVERSGTLYAEATDRYRLLIRKCTGAVQVDEGLDLLLYTGDLDKLLSVLRFAPKGGYAYIICDGEDIQVKIDGFDFSFKQSTSETYPPVERLLPDLDRLDASGWTFVDPRRIKDLSPVGEKHPTLLMGLARSSRNGNPQVVFSADPETEIGVLMGIRTADHDNPLHRLRSTWNWLPNHH